MYNILIAGAGYVGSAIGRYYQARKQRVFGLVRSHASARSLEKEGIRPVIADLTRPETLKNIPPAHFIVISPSPNERSDTGYRKTYMEGIGNFLRALEDNPRPYLMVYLSSTGVWDDPRLDWVGEQDAPNPVSERARILLEAEQQVLKHRFPSLIFRLSGIYGPGRNRIRKLRESVQREPMRDRYMNMIHRDDIVEAIPHLFKQGEEGSVYVGVDDEPVRRSEFYAWLCQKLEMDRPADWIDVSKAAGKRCSNVKLKALGMKFKYPSFQEGYKEILNDGVRALS